MIQTLLPWHTDVGGTELLEYDGNTHEMKRASSYKYLETIKCPHFASAHDLGDPWFKFAAKAKRIRDLE